MFEVLVVVKADENLQAKKKETALMSAASSGQLKTCELLVSAKADVNHQETNGHSVLVVVASSSSLLIRLT